MASNKYLEALASIATRGEPRATTVGGTEILLAGGRYKSIRDGDVRRQRCLCNSWDHDVTRNLPTNTTIIRARGPCARLRWAAGAGSGGLAGCEDDVCRRANLKLFCSWLRSSGALEVGAGERSNGGKVGTQDAGENKESGERRRGAGEMSIWCMGSVQKKDNKSIDTSRSAAAARSGSGKQNRHDPVPGLPTPVTLPIRPSGKAASLTGPTPSWPEVD